MNNEFEEHDIPVGYTKVFNVIFIIGVVELIIIYLILKYGTKSCVATPHITKKSMMLSMLASVLSVIVMLISSVIAA
jgi:heme/copper-type cytochrome/quinol oxidase subunit 2